MPKRLYHKILLVMRLTTIILIASLMQVSATGLAQKISLSKQNASLKAVLKEIRQQSGYNFIYTDLLLKKAKPVSIEVKNEDISKVLDEIFDHQTLTYSIDSKTVVLTEKEVSFIDRIVARFQAIDVRGRVVDDKGQGIPGATVKVKNGKQGTITDSKGNFQLNGIDEGATLVISFLGYQNKEVTANKELGEIALELSTSKLDEVQVIAYGKTTKRYDVGNVASVTAKDIEHSPVTNVLQAIQGRVAGINITSSSGYAGTSMNAQIQGLNSIDNGNSPFIVVDDIPYPTQALPSNIRAFTLSSPNNASVNTLGFINPADIESISILKDADATAIYGSRAANGAIVITTKKGAKGAMKSEFRFDQGWQNVSRYVQLLNTAQYLEMRQEGIRNGGGTVGDYDYDLNGTWDTTRYTDWQKKILGTAKYTNINGSVSGGSDNVTYLAGITYHRETGLMTLPMPNQIFGFHSSLGATSANKKFKANLNTTYQFNNNRLPGSEAYYNAFYLPPDAPALYNSDGTINWEPSGNSPSTFNNPVATTLLTFTSVKVNNLSTSANLSYDILPGLQAKLSAGYNLMTSNGHYEKPLSAVFPSDRIYNNNTASFSNGNQTYWSVDPQLTFQKAFGNSYVDALLGTTLQRQNSQSQNLTGNDYSSELLLGSPAAAGRISRVTSNSAEYRYNAVFARLNYRFKDRYLLNANFRRDGSSRFGTSNRFHDFYSAGGGWIFTEEGFTGFLKPLLSFGKLRANYGTSGNDQVGDYSYINNYGTFRVDVPYNGVVALKPQQLFNPYLQWEQTNKLSMGTNLGFFRDRVLFDLTWYRNRSSNQLLSLSLPGTTGFGGIQTNLAALVENRGLEINLTTVNVKTNDFQWNSSFNFTRNRNKLVRFNDLDQSIYNGSIFVGYPLGTQRTYHYLGVNPTTGNYQFNDANGKPTENPDYNTDRTGYLSLQPDFYGGFNNTLHWKNLILDFLFQFDKRKGRDYSYGLNGGPGLGASNQPVSVLSRWQKPGDQADVQRYDASFSNYGQYAARGDSDGGYMDIRYVRLKNVSLLWDVPQGWLKGSTSVQVFLQGQNVLTFSNSIFDPETGVALPVLRTITAGVKFGL